MTTDNTALGPTWYRFVFDPAKETSTAIRTPGRVVYIPSELPFVSPAADGDSIELKAVHGQFGSPLILQIRHPMIFLGSSFILC